VVVSLDERQIGELIGDVRSLSKAFDQMREENAADHAAVMKRLDRGEERFDRIEQKLEQKMPVEWGQKFHVRLKAVEDEQAEGKGKRALVTLIMAGVVFPVIAGLLVLIATGVSAA
jgi:hypothetical protein